VSFGGLATACQGSAKIREVRTGILAAALVFACAAASSVGAAAEGGRIAYSSRDWPRNGGDNWEIWVLRADGSGRHDVSDETSCDDVAPAWSPTGRRIAFVCRSLTAGNPESLSVMNADGSGVRRVIRSSRNDLGAPSWSPDGRHLAVAFRGYISLVDIATGSTRRLVRGSGATTWSPDGRWIAFNRALGGGGISIVGADGRGLRTLTRGDDGSPAWSPDGRTILFVAQGKIDLIRPDGTGKRTVGFGDDAAWSPDSRWIVFSTEGTTAAGVWIMQRDGSHERHVVHDFQLAGVSWTA
jgi:TolB protein